MWPDPISRKITRMEPMPVQLIVWIFFSTSSFSSMLKEDDFMAKDSILASSPSPPPKKKKKIGGRHIYDIASTFLFFME